MYGSEETAAAISNSLFLKDIVCSKCPPTVSIIMLSLEIFVFLPGQDDLVQKGRMMK